MTYKTYEVKVFDNGNKFWYLNGKFHREDGPAIEWANGDKVWYINGKLHREDGPAIEWADGDKHWYLNGTKYTEDEYHHHNLVRELSVKKFLTPWFMK